MKAEMTKMELMMILMTAMTTDLQTWFMHTAQVMLMLLSLLDFTADFHPRLN